MIIPHWHQVDIQYEISVNDTMMSDNPNTAKYVEALSMCIETKLTTKNNYLICIISSRLYFRQGHNIA